MDTLAFPAVATLVILLLPAIGGALVGVGDRSTSRVRALGASALLLIIAGGGVLQLLGNQPGGGSGADVFSFLALWLGVVLGALIAIIGCGAGLAHAAAAHHWRWLGIQVVGSLLPLVLAGALLSGHLAPQAADGAALSAAPALMAMLLLAGLAPLVTLAYGFWAVRQRWLRAHATLLAAE